MKDYRDNISSHASFDDHHYWSFTRNSRLPHGTFDKPHDWDGIICVVCIVLLALGMLAVNIAP